jgi:hypothetical protein
MNVSQSDLVSWPSFVLGFLFQLFSLTCQHGLICIDLVIWVHLGL